VRQLSSLNGSHFDSGFNSNGNEAIVVQDDTSSALVSIEYATGKKTVLLPASQLNYSIHISCRNTKRPGWAYISEFSGNSSVDKPNYQLTFAVKLDGSGTIQKLATENHSSNTDYSRGAMSVPNPDGTRVLFASDWGDSSDSAPVYNYIAEQNSNTQSNYVIWK
jgi:hypothetical protein